MTHSHVTSDCKCNMTVHVLLCFFSLSVAVVCAVLSPPQNGFFIQSMCNNQYNSACGVRCLPGFELQGSSIRLCQADGTWSGAPPTCTGEAEDSNTHMMDYYMYWVDRLQIEPDIFPNIFPCSYFLLDFWLNSVYKLDSNIKTKIYEYFFKRDAYINVCNGQKLYSRCQSGGSLLVFLSLSYYFKSL